MRFADTFYARRFGVCTQDLERWLGEALSRGGDYADLYLETTETTSLHLDESLIKSATQGVSLGCGVRHSPTGRARGVARHRQTAHAATRRVPLDRAG